MGPGPWCHCRGLGFLQYDAARRRGRSLAIIVALLACGVFMVVAVGANRRDPLRSAGQPTVGDRRGFARLRGIVGWPFSTISMAESGTGGTWGSTDGGFGGGRQPSNSGSMKGDDASCLNLNRAQRPRLLAVQPARALKTRRDAFRFAAQTSGEPKRANRAGTCCCE